jgi:dTDP-glucose 4,6-dehydratase
MNLASPASPKDYLEHSIETLEVGSKDPGHMLQLALYKRCGPGAASAIVGAPG